MMGRDILRHRIRSCALIIELKIVSIRYITGSAVLLIAERR
jgi:hypothetical protein